MVAPLTSSLPPFSFPPTDLPTLASLLFLLHTKLLPISGFYTLCLLCLISFLPRCWHSWLPDIIQTLTYMSPLQQDLPWPSYLTYSTLNRYFWFFTMLHCFSLRLLSSSIFIYLLIYLLSVSLGLIASKTASMFSVFWYFSSWMWAESSDFFLMSRIQEKWWDRLQKECDLYLAFSCPLSLCLWGPCSGGCKLLCCE